MEKTLLGAGVDSLIQHLSCAPNIKRLCLDYVKMTPQKVMGAGISSVIQHLSWGPHLTITMWRWHHFRWKNKELYKNNGENTLLGAGVDSLIQHLSCAPNIKRLWLDYVKMTPQKVMGAGISSVIQHLSWGPHLTITMWRWHHFRWKNKELYKNNGENTLLGAGVDSLIQHLSCVPNIKRLWLDYVKMTPQKVMGAGISSIIQHPTSAPHLTITMWRWHHFRWKKKNYTKTMEKTLFLVQESTA